ncbi:hypothetical protein BHYA_0738g00020 [Botrytis hyacinthi]|uniref:Uncharacterized protein n=1 Tax=Botrytis hyacinthi TaxID=278943 RepID=A0A4Z1GBD6_9HELO|nr:hypothetical protein BHYA_0738g00020 [Botrytis hyacinthi]
MAIYFANPSLTLHYHLEPALLLEICTATCSPSTVKPILPFPLTQSTSTRIPAILLLLPNTLAILPDVHKRSSVKRSLRATGILGLEKDDRNILAAQCCP